MNLHSPGHLWRLDRSLRRTTPSYLESLHRPDVLAGPVVSAPEDRVCACGRRYWPVAHDQVECVSCGLARRGR